MQTLKLIMVNFNAKLQTIIHEQLIHLIQCILKALLQNLILYIYDK